VNDPRCRPWQLGGSDPWEDAESCQHRGSIPRTLRGVGPAGGNRLRETAGHDDGGVSADRGAGAGSARATPGQ
jgi:hypothetical protein